MTTPLTRRSFTKTLLAGVGAAALPAVANAQAKRLKIGCTTLIWGAVPRSPDNLEPALKDMSELGYNGFETFASILEDWDKKGALAEYEKLKTLDAKLADDFFQRFLKK